MNHTFMQHSSLQTLNHHPTSHWFFSHKIGQDANNFLCVQQLRNSSTQAKSCPKSDRSHWLNLKLMAGSPSVSLVVIVWVVYDHASLNKLLLTH